MSAPGEPSVPHLSIHVEIIPPEIYSNANHEQDFTILVSSESVQNCAPGLHAVGARVSMQNVRMAGIDASGNVTPLEKDATTKSMQVPVMFHYEAQRIKLTAKRVKTCEVVWTKVVKVKLPLPRAEPASTWEQSEKAEVKRSKITMEEIAKEQVEFVGPCFSFDFLEGAKNSKFFVRVEVQNARNAETKEPMSFYIDRQWSLRKIAVIGEKALFE